MVRLALATVFAHISYGVFSRISYGVFLASATVFFSHMFSCISYGVSRISYGVFLASAMVFLASATVSFLHQLQSFFSLRCLSHQLRYFLALATVFSHQLRCFFSHQLRCFLASATVFLVSATVFLTSATVFSRISYGVFLACYCALAVFPH